MSDNFITLEDVGLTFRVYSTRNRSIKETVVNYVLRRRYGKASSEVTALKRVNLHIPHGRRLGIVGDNGAGKSCLLKVISRIYKPTTGQVRRQGFLVPLLEVGIGFNFELSGLENIFLTGAIMGFSRRQMTNRVEPILDFSELRDFADTPVKYYSSGMAQRLAFSIATEIDPEILLLDEIFSVGDIHWIEKAKQRMQALINRSSILVVVSHQMDLVQQYCDEVIWLQNGQIVMQGKADDVVESYRAAAAAGVGAEIRHESVAAQ
jgi:ABC-type polysaccharide/polyol phosphate transport system ATPase subunit